MNDATAYDLELARQCLADLVGYLDRASALIAPVDPGFALSCVRASKRAREYATPEVLARWATTAQTSAEAHAVRMAMHDRNRDGR